MFILQRLEFVFRWWEETNNRRYWSRSWTVRFVVTITGKRASPQTRYEHPVHKLYLDRLSRPLLSWHAMLHFHDRFYWLPCNDHLSLEVSNPGLQIIGSNEFSVRQTGLIPVYQKNSCTLLFSGLTSPYRQLESCQPSFQYDWSVDGWMCCQSTTPYGRSI